MLDHSDLPERSYHHGDLRQAILDVAEKRLTAAGVEAVTIRACARDAGVSPAAPIHHFGSLKGLLSALAARGFEQLVARLDAEHSAAGADIAAPVLVGSYVAFSVKVPKMFDLMWRDDMLDLADPHLAAARRVALARLQILSAPQQGRDGTKRHAIRNWSLAHGLATLLLHGRIVTALGDPDDGLVSIDDFVALAFDPVFSGQGDLRA